MQIPTFFSLSLFFFFFCLSLSKIQGLEPSPAPHSGYDAVTPSHSLPPLSVLPEADSGEFSPAKAPVTVEWRTGVDGDLAPVPENGKGGSAGENSDEIPPSRAPTMEAGSDTVRWCAVREELEVCEYFISLLEDLEQSQGHTWKCVKRDTTKDCLESIKKGEADLINLEAGLAYTAFLNYSMKAIANEVYCDLAKSYPAVAVVSRKTCKDNEGISLLDFKGQKSCHGGYSTAAGWNYPITHIKGLFNSEQMNDQTIAMSFFSEVCAPSEFEGLGICNGCGDENGLCPKKSLYFGHSGAFRCLVEGMGNIAFVKADTALLYSMEGPYNQSWSTKSVRDFMYLCPQGGCREINSYPGACSYGSVPANVIMASNSILKWKKSTVLETLTNDTLIKALYERKAGAVHLISPSTQGIDVIKKVTRSYLEKSASISQSIQELNAPKNQGNSESGVSSTSFSCALSSPGIMFISILTILVLSVLSGNRPLQLLF